jgi:hypothetical protein
VQNRGQEPYSTRTSAQAKFPASKIFIDRNQRRGQTCFHPDFPSPEASSLLFRMEVSLYDIQEISQQTDIDSGILAVCHCRSNRADPTNLHTLGKQMNVDTE